MRLTRSSILARQLVYIVLTTVLVSACASDPIWRRINLETVAERGNYTIVTDQEKLLSPGSVVSYEKKLIENTDRHFSNICSWTSFSSGLAPNFKSTEFGVKDIEARALVDLIKGQDTIKVISDLYSVKQPEITSVLEFEFSEIELTEGLSPESSCLVFLGESKNILRGSNYFLIQGVRLVEFNIEIDTNGKDIGVLESLAKSYKGLSYDEFESTLRGTLVFAAKLLELTDNGTPLMNSIIAREDKYLKSISERQTRSALDVDVSGLWKLERWVTVQQDGGSLKQRRITGEMRLERSKEENTEFTGELDLYVEDIGRVRENLSGYLEKNESNQYYLVMNGEVTRGGRDWNDDKFNLLVQGRETLTGKVESVGDIDINTVRFYRVK